MVRLRQVCAEMASPVRELGLTQMATPAELWPNLPLQTREEDFVLKDILAQCSYKDLKHAMLRVTTSQTLLLEVVLDVLLDFPVLLQTILPVV